MVHASVITPARRLSDWVDAYEAALADRQQCDIAEFLPPSRDASFLSVLVELVCIDLERQWRTGTGATIDQYMARFPELQTAPDALSAIAFEEFRQRLLHGDRVDKQDYIERYGIDVAHWPSVTDRSATSFRSGSFAALRDGDSARDASITDRSLHWPRAGESVAGFELLRELGRGAFARVFLARQIELAGRLVVLKLSDRFRGESQAIAQLQHTNIVPIYSQHQIGRLHALCMPYLGSTTLADALRVLKADVRLPKSGQEFASTLANCGSSVVASNDSPVSAIQCDEARCDPDANADTAPLKNWQFLTKYNYIESVLWLFGRLALGLDHAHQRGVLHHDLKPANVLLRDDGEPMLLDFNLSSQTAQSQVASRVVLGGTLPYMAPEQIRALRGESIVVGPSADIFSLGVALHEMLTGKRPFATVAGMSDDALDSALAAIAAGPTPAVLSGSEISPAVRAISAKCLASEPDQRYATAGHLAEDLQRQLEHLPLVHTTNPSWIERIDKWRVRHPRATGISAIASVALAAIVVVASLWWSAEQSIAQRHAQDTLEQFIDDSLDAQFLLAAGDPSSWERQRGRELAVRSLDIYGVSSNHGGDESLGRSAANLSAADQDRLRAEIADLRAAMSAESATLEAQAPASSSPDAECLAESTQALYHRARQEYAAGRFADAIELLTAAISRQPRQIRYWMLRGRAEEALLQDESAIASYTACIVLKPAWAPAYVHRGAAAFRQKKYQDAKSDFDKALNYDATSIAALVNRALALQQLGDFEAAVRDLDRAIVLDPDRTRFYHLRARLHRRAGNLKLAAQDERLAMLREPNDAEGWIARGVFLLPRKPHEALAAFEAATKLNPRSIEGLRNSAHVLAEYLKQPDRAIDVLTRTIEVYPDSAPAVLGRGVLLARQGKREAAITDARLGLKLDAGPEAHYQAACIYAQTSRSSESDRDEAIGLLFAAVHLGFDRGVASRDPDLIPIRSHPDFRRLVESASSIATAK